MIWDLQASYNIGVQLVSLNPPALSLKLVKGRREPKLLPLRMTDCPGARTNKEGRWKEWTDAYLAQFFKLPTPFGVFLLSSFFRRLTANYFTAVRRSVATVSERTGDQFRRKKLS